MSAGVVPPRAVLRFARAATPRALARPRVFSPPALPSRRSRRPARVLASNDGGDAASASASASASSASASPASPSSPSASSGDDGGSPFPPGAPPSPPPPTKPWSPPTAKEAWRRMWTRADKYHAHGVSGAAFTLLGAFVLAAWAKSDVDALLGDAASRELLVSTSASGPELWGLASVSFLVAGVCAVTGAPLARSRGWRKAELSYRSAAFQFVLTWQAFRLGPGAFAAFVLAPLDRYAWPIALFPFVWQTLTSAYILTRTKDDPRSAALIFVGAWLFGAQVFPAAAVIAAPGGLAALAESNPGLAIVWCHSLLGLVWLLNWSTLGASLRARGVVDDAGYRAGFLLRPSLAWLALFALDVAAYQPFESAWEYVATLGGVRGLLS
jgi:hypothetical protein